VDRESSIWINRIATPLGSMIMGVSDQGLCLLEFAERRMLDTQLKRLRQRMGRVFLPGDHPLMQQVKSELDAYFDGSLRKFSVPLQAPGTVFQESVWNALRKIPYGETRSYGDIAGKIGQASAVRAVGRANGDNRIAIIIPCHRVVGSDGELTGYGGGLWRKEYLLAMEQAQAFHLT
jgi:AraC family transcriptional regulator of adaptative response/methylated-DNA-[protein]-cysteine methyltransferase